MAIPRDAGADGASAHGALTDVHVLEFTQSLAGPFAGLLLSDMGADVIKVEPPEGEPFRQNPSLVPGESRNYAGVNRGKRCITLDLDGASARPIVERLARWAHVVLMNYRPGSAERLGIDYETLARINPAIVYVDITPYGSEGTLADEGGFDVTVQAFSGLMITNGNLARAVPWQIVPAVTDYGAGMLAALGATAALLARASGADGQRVDISLLATAMAIQTNRWTNVPAEDDEPRAARLERLRDARAEQRPYEEQLALVRQPSEGNIYYRPFQTRDGFIAVGCQSVGLRARLLEVTGLQDARFADPAHPDFSRPFAEEGEALVAEAEALFRTRTTEQWLGLLREHGLPAAPVHFPDELWEDEQLKANGMIADLEHPVLGSMQTFGTTIKMSATPTHIQGPAPLLAEHSADVLRTLGYSEEEINAFREAAVVGFRE